ncbi:MAG: hypothetical protein U0X39_14295 [Bacteroidales bacterium]
MFQLLLEKETLRKGPSLHDLILDEMNVIWEGSKKEDNRPTFP